jgi:hypothetical protein
MEEVIFQSLSGKRGAVKSKIIVPASFVPVSKSKFDFIHRIKTVERIEDLPA